MSLEDQIAHLERRRNACLDRLEEQTSQLSTHLREELSPVRLITQYLGLPMLIGAGLGTFFGWRKNASGAHDPESQRSSILKAVIQKIIEVVQAIIHGRHTQEVGHDAPPETPAIDDAQEADASDSHPQSDGSVLPIILGQIVEAVPWSQVFSALSDRLSSRMRAKESSAPADSGDAAEPEE